MAMTHRNLLEKFSEMLLAEKQLSNNSLTAYQKDIRDFLFYLKQNNLNLESLTNIDIHNLIAKLYEPLNKSSQARKISAIKQFFKFLQSENIIDKNIMDNIKPPTLAKKIPNFLSIDEVIKLLNKTYENKTINGVRHITMLELLYATGLRVSELVELKLNSLHYEDNLSTKVSNFIIILGKGKKERLIPLHNVAQKRLNEYLKIRKKLKFYNPQSNKWLFPSTSKEGHITRQRFAQILKETAIECGINSNKVSPHTLRHSFASHLLNNGTDLRAIQELLGHSNITTTEIYTHILDKNLKDTLLTKHPLAKN